jgi:YVTN family beta-propeller protein
MISRYKTLSLVLLASVGVVLLAGCNDTLRQFIITVPQPAGNPAAIGNAVVLATNPAGNGSTTHINTSGDTLAGIVTVGVNPVFLGKGGGNAFIINGDGTLSAYTGLGSLGATANTITPFPTTGLPVAGGTSSTGNFFTANPTTNNSSVVSSSVSAETTIIPVGPAGVGPVAIAGSSVNSKVYIVNQGSNNVTVVSTTDNTVIKPSIPVGAQPIWGVMSADGVDIFIVNQGDGTVSVIDTTLDIVIATIAVGPSPNFAFYDPNRERLYVSNTGNNTISVIKADGINLGVTPQILPTLLKNIPVSGTPVSVAALSDGSKVYSALGNCPAGTNHLTLLANLSSCTGNLVSVIDAVGLRETKTITVGPGVVSVDVSGDAAKAYVQSAQDITTIIDNVHNPSCASAPCGVGGNCTVAPCLPGPILPPQTFPTPSISIIRTSTDTVLATPVDATVTSRPLPTFHTPVQVPTCTPTLNTNFNKTVPIPCAEQIPFMIRIFP